jgi:hypothetical protein
MNNVDKNGYIIEPEELNQEYESSQFLMLTYDILVDKRLSDFQKLLFASITGLCKQRGYCWAGNAYFQKLFNRSQTQVSEGISKLVEYGYLKREIVYKKKEDKDGKIITTKQISFRKLFVVINKADWNTGIPENQNRGIPENQKQIDNPLIDNPTSNNSILSKDNKNYIEDNTETVVNNTDDNIKNNNIEDKNGIEDSKIFSGKADTSASVLKTPAAEGEEKPKKGKGGLGPLYDEITKRIPAAIYPTLNAALKTYLKAHLGIRRLPSPEKWEDMIKKLQEYASVELSGASGKKFMENRALEIVKKAIDGKDGVPYTDFDDIYDKGLMEPTFELNRDYTKGY